MKFVYVFVAALFMTSASLAQSQSPPAWMMFNQPETKVAPKGLSYSDALESANKKNVPLVVFIGVQPRNVNSVKICTQVRCTFYTPVTCGTNSLTGFPERCIVISLPEGGNMMWKATLPANATDQQIHDELVRQLQRRTTLEQSSAAPTRVLPLFRNC